MAILGVAIIVIGAIVLLRGASFTRKEDIVKIGDVKVSADKKQSIPAWAGGVAIIAGIAVVAASRQRA
jgi:UDP-N-acetylmuramyl pentapeptide phosphotransferase/UDP-N-acetylglucosamine-1-phosphate transferase